MSAKRRVDDVRVVCDLDEGRWTCTFGHTDWSIRTYELKDSSHWRIAALVRRLCEQLPLPKWASFPTVYGWHAWERKKTRIEYR